MGLRPAASEEQGWKICLLTFPWSLLTPLICPAADRKISHIEGSEVSSDSAFHGEQFIHRDIEFINCIMVR